MDVLILLLIIDNNVLHPAGIFLAAPRPLQRSALVFFFAIPRILAKVLLGRLSQSAHIEASKYGFAHNLWVVLSIYLRPMFRISDQKHKISKIQSKHVAV